MQFSSNRNNEYDNYDRCEVYLEGDSLEFIDGNKLEYRAEGNANIVLSMVEKRLVLRLRKSKIDQQIETKEFIDLQRFIQYSGIISILFAETFVSKPKLAFLNTCDLDSFNKNLMKLRPTKRLDKEIRNCYGILYPDVAFLPPKLNTQIQYAQENKSTSNTFCIEIKPKQGWSFYDDDYFDDEISYSNETNVNFPSVQKCRYCLAQYLKLQKKSIQKVSKYCPLDLFSGKPLRILNAIKGLIGAPQNNFKILKNGNIVYSDDMEKFIFNKILKEIFGAYKTKEERKTLFMNLMKDILTKDFTSSNENTDHKVLTIRKNRKKKDKHLIHERVCNPINYKYLPKNCVLRQILDVQLLAKSSLDFMVNRKKDKPEDTHSYSYIDELLQKFSTQTNNLLQPKDAREKLSEEEKYLIGATALDCSIMITFRKLLDGDSLNDNVKRHIVTVDNMKFVANVTVMDLDPKPQQHFAKHSKQLHTSHMAYKDFIAKLRH